MPRRRRGMSRTVRSSCMRRASLAASAAASRAACASLPSTALRAGSTHTVGFDATFLQQQHVYCCRYYRFIAKIAHQGLQGRKAQCCQCALNGRSLN